MTAWVRFWLAILVPILWMVPSLGAISVGMHVALEHHGHGHHEHSGYLHGEHEHGEHEHGDARAHHHGRAPSHVHLHTESLWVLVHGAFHGAHHCLFSSDHTHGADHEGFSSPPRAKEQPVTPSLLQPLETLSPAPPRQTISHGDCPTPPALFTTHCALLI